jgi:hypothetical protein
MGRRDTREDLPLWDEVMWQQEKKVTRGNFLSVGENADGEIKKHLIQNGVISFRGLSGPLFSFIRCCCVAVKPYFLILPYRSKNSFSMQVSDTHLVMQCTKLPERTHPCTHACCSPKTKDSLPFYARVQNRSVSRFYSKTEQAAPSFSKGVDNQST